MKRSSFSMSTWTAWSRSSKEVIPTKSGFADRRSGWMFIHEMTTSDQGSENDIRPWPQNPGRWCLGQRQASHSWIQGQKSFWRLIGSDISWATSNLFCDVIYGLHIKAIHYQVFHMSSVPKRSTSIKIFYKRCQLWAVLDACFDECYWDEKSKTSACT